MGECPEFMGIRSKVCAFVDVVIMRTTVSGSFLYYSLDIESCPSKTDRFLVRTSFLEIYNERISDLMVCAGCDWLTVC